MRIEELLNKKKDRKLEGKTIFIRLLRYLPKETQEERFFGTVKRASGKALTVETEEGELSFPPEYDAVCETEDKEEAQGAELSAVISIYGRNYR